MNLLRGWLKVSLKMDVGFVVNFDEQKKEVLSEKAEIEKEMVQMASGMKEFANNFKTQFERDQLVLKQISAKQDKNIAKTNEENDKINKIEKGIITGTF